MPTKPDWDIEKCHWDLHLLRKWQGEMSPIQKPIFRYFFGVFVRQGYSREEAARWAWGANHWWWGRIRGPIRGRILREFDIPGWVWGSEPGMVDWSTVPVYIPGREDDDRKLSDWTAEFSLTAQQLRR